MPARATRKPPLIFVHGGYGDAWCWEPYFLPWFAAKGWPAYALSAARPRHQQRRRDAVHRGPRRLCRRCRACRRRARRRADPDRPLDGRRDLERMWRRARSAAPRCWRPCRLRDCCRSPRGSPQRIPTTCRIRRARPDAPVGRILKALRPFYFSDRVDPAILAGGHFHLKGESPRALFDLVAAAALGAAHDSAVAGVRHGRRRRPDLDSRRCAARPQGITASTPRSCPAAPTC